MAYVGTNPASSWQKCPELDERERSKLMYLAAALVTSADWREELSLVDDPALIPPSHSLRLCLTHLEDALGKMSVREAAQVLLDQDEPVREAGRALAWALEKFGQAP